MNNKSTWNKDFSSKQIQIEKTFKAPVEKVWEAFTTKEILDRWWAPAPWKAETKEMDFRVGGHWLYSMVGPEGERHWSRADFTSINIYEHLNVRDYFCDENGQKNEELPVIN